MRNMATLGVGLLMAATPVLAQDEDEGPHSLSFTVTGVSDYVFRGVSQTQEDPALQGAIDYKHESGFYLGVWGSNIDFTPDGADFDDGADLEVDLYGGFRWSFNDDWSADVNVTRYMYPGTEDGYDYDYNELIGKLTYRWATFTLGYSNDVFNSDEDGIYYQVSGSWSLPYELTLGAGIGHYDLDDALSDSYTDWSVGLSRSFGRATVGLTYFDTDSSGEDLFGPNADSRVVLSVSFGF